jgi:hypothetical protein
MKSLEFGSGARLCNEHKVSVGRNNFSVIKMNGPRKPEIFFS